MPVLAAASDIVLLVLGLVLVVAAITITRVLAFLVRQPRPPVFAGLQQFTIWLVGGVVTLVGLILIIRSLADIA